MTTDGRAQVLVLEDFPQPNIARALSPNGRAHWATKRAWAKHTKRLVYLTSLVQHIQPMVGYVVMQPTFIYPVRRKRDDDNLATGVLKAVRDGLVDAGLLLADDMQHLEQLRPVVEVQKKRRALILEFRSGVQMTSAHGVSATIDTEYVDHQPLTVKEE